VFGGFDSHTPPPFITTPIHHQTVFDLW